MNAQIYQSIKLMELPVVELRERIQEEVERNPALESLEDHSVVSLDASYSRNKESDEYFEATSDPGFIRQSGDSAQGERRNFIEEILSRPETLQEHLAWNLRLQPVSDEIRRLGELLIQNLDTNGFHKEPLDLLLKDEDPRVVEESLQLVRSLDPQGTCTENYLESLAVQAQLLFADPSGELEALKYLEALERGAFGEVARRINRSEAETREIVRRIQELNPFPGRQFESDDTRYVVPDVQVVRREEEFVIILNEEEIPILGINPFFMKMSDATDGEKPVRDFVRENIREARWFIQSINQRNHTLLRVSRAIVEFQRSFFLKGPKFLAPLTLRDISQELGFHEATVSRAANGKYMQTEWGIFEIRHFFTNSISGSGSGGSRYSKEGVKEVIRELISQENKRFSDQEIANSLAQLGIHVARRTVAKYRKELDLGSSYAR